MAAAAPNLLTPAIPQPIADLGALAAVTHALKQRVENIANYVVALGVSPAAAAASSGGVISYSLPVASETVLGGVMIDGTTVTVTSGVLSATGGALATDFPLMDGVAFAGVAAVYARGDHVHPVDTTRYAASNPAHFATRDYVDFAVAAAGAPGSSAVFATLTTGFAVTIADTCSSYVIKAAGALAAGAITLPAAPVHGQLLSLCTDKTVSAFTVNPNAGQSLAAPISGVSFDANRNYNFIYELFTTTWHWSNVLMSSEIMTTGGVTTAIQVVPVVQAAAYAAGACVGAAMTFTGAARVSAGSGMVQAATVTFSSGVIPSLDLILFSAAPAGGTITDRVALAIAAADLAKVVGVVHMTDNALLGAASPSVVQGETQALPFKLASGTSLFGVLVTRTAITLTSTTDATVTLNVMQD